jgi:hypothetical protein
LSSYPFLFWRCSLFSRGAARTDDTAAPSGGPSFGLAFQQCLEPAFPRWARAVARTCSFLPDSPFGSGRHARRPRKRWRNRRFAHSPVASVRTRPPDLAYDLEFAAKIGVRGWPSANPSGESGMDGTLAPTRGRTAPSSTGAGIVDQSGASTVLRIVVLRRVGDPPRPCPASVAPYCKRSAEPARISNRDTISPPPRSRLLLPAGDRPRFAPVIVSTLGIVGLANPSVERPRPPSGAQSGPIR